jgi:hypothetical protein
MNPLQAFGENLKQHRQTQQISLLQISAATRIHVRFLEAIEAGTFSVLPEPYIRAFIREYAETVELNPADVLKLYDDALRQMQPVSPPRPHRKSPLSFAVIPQQRLLALAQRYLMLPLAFLALLLVVLVLSNAGSTRSSHEEPKEISFDRVVHESEAALVNHRTPPQPSAALFRAPTDSLRLEITTVDSLWIMVVIDRKRTVEYLFPPKYHRVWVARDQFTITMGNAGGATFRLNGKELGALGKRGAVVRNVVLTAESIADL